MKKQFFKYSIAIITFLGCVFLNNPLLMKENILPIGIFICQFINIIVAFTGFIMVLTNINDEGSNKMSVLAYGYFLISFLLVLNLYLYIEANRMPPIPFDYSKNRLFIHMLEGAVIYSTLNVVSEKQSIKMWMMTLAAAVLIGFGMVVGKNSIVYKVSKDAYKIIYCMIIATIVFAWYKSQKQQPYGKEFECMEKAMFFKVVYLVGVIAVTMKMNSLSMLALYGIDTIHYIYIYEFIYRVTIRQFWYSTDKRLNNTQNELEKEEIEKHNLVLASYALKKYVKIIDHEADLLRKKMEKSCGERSLLHVDKINKNCRRLMKLSNNILDLGQMDMGNVAHHYKNTNMNQLIEVLVESILPYVESRGLQIEIKQSQTPIYCLVDTDEIERVLLNIISNAIKYSKKNGKINVYINEKQGRLYVCIEDTGIGIPEEKLQNIFGRFERVETGFSRTQEGSGLGLAIVKSIIEMHQGSINICSKEGQGTLVSFSLPIYEGQKNRQIDIRPKTMLKRKIEVEFADLKK